MRKILYTILGIFTLSSILISCNKDDDKSVSFGKITNITSESSNGEIIFSWTNPSDPDFFYVDIQYVDSKGLQRSKKVSRFNENEGGHEIDSVTIGGFANTESYSFTFYACDKEGNRSVPESYSAAPLTPAFDQVASSMKLTSDFGGATVTWENITKQTVSIQVKYKSNEGENKISTFSAIPGKGEGSISGLNTNEKKFTIIVLDKAANESSPQEFTIIPLEEIKLPKTNWKVVDFSSDIDEGGGAGTVAKAFDGNLTSFWHTNWNPVEPYPHHVVIDMGEQVTISRFVTFRRQNNNNVPKVIKFQTSDDGVNFTEDGVTYTMDGSTNEGTSNRVKTNPKGRYFKFIGVSSATGAQYMCIGEIDVYGSIK